LAKIVQLEISDLGGLRQIEGIGESRIKEYGSALLEVLNESPANP
jgi:hypothetical protein